METLIARLVEFTGLTYCLAVILLGMDFIQNRPKEKKYGLWILTGVWLLQTVALILQFVYSGRITIFNVYEGLYFFSWVLIGFSLMANKFLKIDFLLFLTNVIGFIMMIIYTFSNSRHFIGNKLHEQMISHLLVAHVVLAILSYGAFAISFVLSTMYLYQYKNLKQKKWGQNLFRIGDLDKLEKNSGNLVVVGLPFLFVALVLGLQWAYLKIPDVIWYDVKIIGSILLFIVYGFYVYLRNVRKFHGKNLAVWNVVGFIFVLLNFFVLNNFSKFHIW